MKVKAYGKKTQNEMQSCHWNRVPVNKIFLEQPSPKPKVKVMIPMYEPLETSKCEKCGKIIAEKRTYAGSALIFFLRFWYSYPSWSSIHVFSVGIPILF